MAADLWLSVHGVILSLFSRQQDQFGMGLQLISHNLAVVRRAATRVAVMTTEEIFRTGGVRPALDRSSLL